MENLKQQSSYFMQRQSEQLAEARQQLDALRAGAALERDTLTVGGGQRNAVCHGSLAHPHNDIPLACLANCRFAVNECAGPKSSPNARDIPNSNALPLAPGTC